MKSKTIPSKGQRGVKRSRTKNAVTSDDSNFDKLPLSKWLQELNIHSMRASRKKDYFSINISEGYKPNPDIFSFNDNNINLFSYCVKNHGASGSNTSSTGRRKSGKKPKKSSTSVDGSSTATATATPTTTESKKINKELQIKSIMNYRKEQLKSIITQSAELVQHFKKIKMAIENVVDNIMKYEMLGFGVIKQEFPVLCYFTGFSNTEECFKDIKNWKILPTSLLSIFHSHMAMTSQDKKLDIQNYYTSLKDKGSVPLQPLFLGYPEDLGIGTSLYNLYDNNYHNKGSSSSHSTSNKNPSHNGEWLFSNLKSEEQKFIHKFHIELKFKNNAWPQIIGFDPRFILLKWRTALKNIDSSNKLHVDKNSISSFITKQQQQPSTIGKKGRSSKIAAVPDKISKQPQNIIEPPALDSSMEPKPSFTKEEWDQRAKILPSNIKFGNKELGDLVKTFLSNDNRTVYDKDEYVRVPIQEDQLINCCMMGLDPIGCVALATGRTEDKFNLKTSPSNSSIYDGFFNQDLKNDEIQSFFRSEVFQHLNAMVAIDLITRNLDVGDGNGNGSVSDASSNDDTTDDSM